MCQNLWPDELRILVIDDDQDILNLIRLSLEQAGFRVLRTTKPEEGLAMVLREKIAEVVTTCPMPWSEENSDLVLTLSVGISCYPDEAETAESLINLADQGLYRQKGARKQNP